MLPTARQAPREAMTAKRLPCATGLRERVRVLIEDVRFETAITALIVANAITLGLETSPAVVARIGGVLHVIDRTVLGVFVVETSLP
jgi:voltage-gated sodium channel